MSPSLHLTSILWRSQPAWRLTNGRIALVVTKVGGHIAAITSVNDNINPMWQARDRTLGRTEDRVH